jgi:predicted TIM-barrel fold metal-dependent hydrolase
VADALERLGRNFIGVTQLPASVSDEELEELHLFGVRAVRFNVKRGGSEDLGHLDSMARRIHELHGWHVELYIDARELAPLLDTLVALPAVAIDHLGLSREGLAHLLWLAERGVRIKASGFGRVDFDVREALRNLFAANPDSLMFGTDLPSTRAGRPYSDRDFQLVVDTLGETAARRVLHDNAAAFYRVGAAGRGDG